MNNISTGTQAILPVEVRRIFQEVSCYGAHDQNWCGDVSALHVADLAHAEVETAGFRVCLDANSHEGLHLCHGQYC